MASMTPSLLQPDEHEDQGRWMTDVQPTFRQPLGRVLGCCCFRSNGLQAHCQQYHLTIIVDEFAPSIRGMASAAHLRR